MNKNKPKLALLGWEGSTHTHKLKRYFESKGWVVSVVDKKMFRSFR